MRRFQISRFVLLKSLIMVMLLLIVVLALLDTERGKFSCISVYYLYV